MNEVIRVLDVSEFTRDIPWSFWDTVRDQHGVRAAVVQAWGGGYAGDRRNIHFKQQSEGALAAGLGLAAYCWPPADWRQAIDHIDASGLRERLAFFALDVEAGEGVAAQHVAGVRNRGMEPVIYVSPGGWSDIMGDTRSFADVPLWVARYPTRHDVPAASAINWETEIGWALVGYGRVGGWTPLSVIGWQFRGTTDIENEQADLNLFWASAFGIEEDLTVGQYEELKRGIADTNGVVVGVFKYAKDVLKFATDVRAGLRAHRDGVPGFAHPNSDSETTATDAGQDARLEELEADTAALEKRVAALEGGE